MTFGRNKFPKACRIKKNLEFKETLSKRQMIRGVGFDICFARNDKSHASRLGVIIRKNFGNSVERNKAKRRIREIFRTNDKVSGLDIIIRIKPEMKCLAFEEIKNEYLRLIDVLITKI